MQEKTNGTRKSILTDWNVIAIINFELLFVFGLFLE